MICTMYPLLDHSFHYAKHNDMLYNNANLLFIHVMLKVAAHQNKQK